MTTTKTRTKKASSRFRQELLDELLTEIKEPSSDVFSTAGMFQELKAALMERMLEGELTHHLGYGKHTQARETTEDQRNGSYPKTVHTGQETVTIQVPRDRDGDFRPQLLKKGQRRLEGFDDKVLSPLYARGMSMREIQEHLYEIYGTDVSAELISEVTDSVLEEVKTWQSRPLDAVYPILYLGTWMPWWSKSEKTIRLCRNRCSLPLMSPWRARKIFWASGWLKTRGQSSGWLS